MRKHIAEKIGRDLTERLPRGQTDRKFDSKRPGVRGFGGEGFIADLRRQMRNPV